MDRPPQMTLKLIPEAEGFTVGHPADRLPDSSDTERQKAEQIEV